MGYQGESEKLCEKGHYYAADVASDHYDEACPHCGKPWVWTHEVDWTNGYDENDPNTYKARKVPTGTEDVWHKDHYGNKYATVLQQYTPAADSHWINIAFAAKQREEEHAQMLADRRWVIAAQQKDGPKVWDHIWGWGGLNNGTLQPELMLWIIADHNVQFTSEDAAQAQIEVLKGHYPEFEFRIGVTSV